MPSINFRFIQLLTLAVGAAGVQFLTAYWGNELTVQYETIGSVCSEIDYIDTDIKFQKALRIVIQRSQKPVQFTVGKFAPLTLKTFELFMKMAYSCFMLLHNLNSGITLDT